MEEKTINGEVFIKKSELDLRTKAKIKLMELLENIDKNTATPEMLEAAAKIGEVLLEF